MSYFDDDEPRITYRCAGGCGEILEHDSIQYIEDDEVYCKSCAESYFNLIYCESCGEFVDFEETIYIEDEVACPFCKTIFGEM